MRLIATSLPNCARTGLHRLGILSEIANSQECPSLVVQQCTHGGSFGFFSKNTVPEVTSTGRKKGKAHSMALAAGGALVHHCEV